MRDRSDDPSLPLIADVFATILPSPIFLSLFRNYSKRQVPGRKEMFYLTTHSIHFIYGYMASDIW